MKINSFFYQLKQGFLNIHRNRLFSLASIATIAASIFIFGIFYSLVANFQYTLNDAQTNLAVTVFFDDDIDDAMIQTIGDEIQARPEVDRIHYTSAEEAWENFKTEYLGEYEYLADGFSDNPLANSASYEVYLKDASQQQELVDYISSLDGVRQVNRSEDAAASLSGAARLVGYISVAVIIVLLAVSIFLIMNTVIIGITVRKEEISIMKYIGATDGFVNAPFFVEGITIGVIGSIIPMIIEYFLYNGAVDFVQNKFAMLNNILRFMSTAQLFRVLLPVALLLGVVIGLLGTFFAVRRHTNV